MTAPTSRYDLRMRSIDRKPDDPINACCTDGCDEWGVWSVWLHTPEWGDGDRGGTYVRCTKHALILVQIEALGAKP